MPFYDYKCDKCENMFEEFNKIADRESPTRRKCPSCGEKGSVRQVITGIGGVGVDKNHRIDGNAKGGFKDVMQKLVDAPGIKGSRREQYLKTRYGI